ncbi:chemerin-like receptor 1 [Lithobates pipiens]
MENISIYNLTSSFEASDGSQGRCLNLTKEDNHIARIINISSAVICSLEFLVGITASGYVIWMKVYRLEKTFRSVLSHSLFISGFIWSIFLLLNIVYFACNINWTFGSFMCQLHNFMFHLNMFINAFTLTLYSVDYCFVVIWPFKYNVYRRPHLALVEVIVCWIIAVCISVPYFFFKTTYECYSAIKCFNRFDDTEITNIWKHGNKVIAIIAFILGYGIPILIILLCFIITAKVYHQKKTSKYTPALKMIFTFQTLFAVCWLPYHVLSLIKLSLSTSGEKNLVGVVEMVQPITICLASLGGSVNPIFYAFISPDFKKQLAKYRK